jgi:hypothetical protein
LSFFNLDNVCSSEHRPATKQGPDSLITITRLAAQKRAGSTRAAPTADKKGPTIAPSSGARRRSAPVDSLRGGVSNAAKNTAAAVRTKATATAGQKTVELTTPPPAAPTAQKGSKRGRRTTQTGTGSGDKENAPRQVQEPEQMDFGGDNFDPVEDFAESAPLQELTVSALNAPRSAGRPPLGRRNSTTTAGAAAAVRTPYVDGPVKSAARMRTPADQIPSGAGGAKDKENVYTPAWLQRSPATSQTGTHVSKRKYGRPIQPVPMPAGVDWLNVEEPPVDEKMKALAQRRESALEQRQSEANTKVSSRSSTNCLVCLLTLLGYLQKPSKSEGAVSDRRPIAATTSSTSTKKRASTSTSVSAAAPQGSVLLKQTSSKARMHTSIASFPPSIADSVKLPRAAADVAEVDRDEVVRDVEEWGDAAAMVVNDDGGGEWDADYPADVHMEVAHEEQARVEEGPVRAAPASVPAAAASWRRTEAPAPTRAAAAVPSSLSAKLFAGRADLAHSVAAQFPSTAEPAPPHEVADQGAEPAPTGPFQLETFSQALPRPYSQVSRTSHASSLGARSAVLDVEDPFSGPPEPPRARTVAERGKKGQASPQGRVLGKRGRVQELQQEGEVSGSEDPSGSSFEENEVIAA